MIGGLRSIARASGRVLNASASANHALNASTAAGIWHEIRLKSTEALTDELVAACDAVLAKGERINWVFLGAPGVGKGTYSTRISKLMKIPHISAGDLVRDEIKSGSEKGKQMVRRCKLTSAS